MLGGVKLLADGSKTPNYRPLRSASVRLGRPVAMGGQWVVSGWSVWRFSKGCDLSSISTTLHEHVGTSTDQIAAPR